MSKPSYPKEGDHPRNKDCPKDSEYLTAIILLTGPNCTKSCDITRLIMMRSKPSCFVAVLFFDIVVVALIVALFIFG